jgi:hypothetical protein
VGVLEYALSLARDLAHSWPRGPHQYYLCATPPSSFYREIVYDFILIVINRYSKMVQYIPYNKDIDAKELAEIIKNRIF